MRYIITVLKFIFSIYALLVFILLMFLLLPIAFFASFLGKIKGGNIIYKLCRFWADASMFFWGMPHTNYYEAPHDTNKSYVFLINHISYMDIPMMLKAIRKQHFRALGKAEMAQYPVFGFFYRNTAVMVDRSDAANRLKSVQLLTSIIRKKISIVIAPEGTFNMTHQPLKPFFSGAFKIAIETQTPIKPVLLLDGYSRMNYASVFSVNPGPSRAVFLEEIAVDGLTLEDTDLLREKVFRIMEAKLIEYKANWIKPAIQ